MPVGFGFNPQSGHMKDSTSEYMGGWNNGLMFLSLSSQSIKKVVMYLSSFVSYFRVKKLI